MKNVFLLMSIVCFVSCGNQKKVVSVAPEVKSIAINQTVPDDETVILLGLADENGLKQEPFNDWYNQNYKDYEVDESSTASLRHLLKDIKIKVFMGTWCSDSQREIPRFFKILEKAGYDKRAIELVTMTREKDTPKGYEVGLNITNVPTFIFYKNEKEINRIVESPITSLEKDMIAILTGQEYKHTYAN